MGGRPAFILHRRINSQATDVLQTIRTALIPNAAMSFHLKLSPLSVKETRCSVGWPSMSGELQNSCQEAQFIWSPCLLSFYETKKLNSVLLIHLLTLNTFFCIFKGSEITMCFIIRSLKLCSVVKIH